MRAERNAEAARRALLRKLELQDKVRGGCQGQGASVGAPARSCGWPRPCPAPALAACSSPRPMPAAALPASPGGYGRGDEAARCLRPLPEPATHPAGDGAQPPAAGAAPPAAGPAPPGQHDGLDAAPANCVGEQCGAVAPSHTPAPAPAHPLQYPRLPARAADGLCRVSSRLPALPAHPPSLPPSQAMEKLQQQKDFLSGGDVSTDELITRG